MTYYRFARLALFAFLLLPLVGSGVLAAEARLVVHGDQEKGAVSRHLYGHFAEHLGRCIYDGIWVGEGSDIPNTRGMRTDIIDALRAIDIPNLRWPGGCFADDYHWRDGIGPKDQRPKRVNIHWGEVIDTNAFGTHEFLDLCELLDCEPYIAGNVGSGTPQEMRDWIEYMTYDGDSQLANLRRRNGREEPWRVKYFGVGNENWGCGGNMRPEYYGDLYRRFATYCRSFGDNKLVRVACGPSGADRKWSKAVMGRAHRHMEGYSLHYYTQPAPWRGKKLPATGFKEDQWFRILDASLGMQDAVQTASEEMDKVDPRKRIELYVDEWGTWYQAAEGHPDHGLYQQNTLRDALVAVQTLHILHQHNDRVKMANIAQTVNVLQAMILTDGPRMLLTPTYHAFNLMKGHHDAERLGIELESPDYAYQDNTMPALSAGATRTEDGVVTLSISNADPHQAIDLTCELNELDAGRVSGRIITADELDAHNTFDQPEHVKPADFDGAKLKDGRLELSVPPHCVLVLELRE